MVKPNELENIFLTDEMVEHQAMLDLERYAALTGKEITFPIYPEEIIEKLWSVSIENRESITDDRGAPAFAYFSPKERSVFVNLSAAAESEGRSSFTIAHEAGHISLHDFASNADDSVCFGYSNTSGENRERIKEHQAERYASDLLMPRDTLYPRVQEILSRTKTTSLDLSQHGRELCKYFNVSLQALEIRLDQLGIATRNAYYPKKIKRVDDRVFDVMEQERATWSFNE
jgi:Zn-dependent peptidase ImmA (M78 family)